MLRCIWGSLGFCEETFLLTTRVLCMKYLFLEDRWCTCCCASLCGFFASIVECLRSSLWFQAAHRFLSCVQKGTDALSSNLVEVPSLRLYIWQPVFVVCSTGWYFPQPFLQASMKCWRSTLSNWVFLPGVISHSYYLMVAIKGVFLRSAPPSSCPIRNSSTILFDTVTRLQSLQKR